MQQTVHIHLDWMTATVPYRAELGEQVNVSRALPQHEMFQPTGETFIPGKGYSKGLKLGVGKLMYNPARAEQGMGLQLTGKDLEQYRAAGCDELELLRFVDMRGGQVATLHAAIDLHDAGAHPIEAYRAWQHGKLKTRARMVSHYGSTRKVGKKWQQASTVYIGSAKSQVQIRVYDKAAEQRVNGDWTRIEIIWRGKYAHAAHRAMLSAGIPAVTRGSILHQVDWQSQWWAFAMLGDTSQPEAIRRGVTARFTWLKSVALPALRKEIAEERRQNYDDAYALFAGFMREMAEQAIVAD